MAISRAGRTTAKHRLRVGLQAGIGDNLANRVILVPEIEAQKAINHAAFAIHYFQRPRRRQLSPTLLKSFTAFSS